MAISEQSEGIFFAPRDDTGIIAFVLNRQKFLIPGGEQTSLLKINSFKLIFNGKVNAMKDYDVIVVGSGAGAIIVEQALVCISVRPCQR